MFKINIIHILLFLIIICLLYTLLSNCGCSKDGFSIGGQEITQEDILPKNQNIIIDFNSQLGGLYDLERRSIGTRINLKSVSTFDSINYPVFYPDSEYYVYSDNSKFWWH